MNNSNNDLAQAIYDAIINRDQDALTNAIEDIGGYYWCAIYNDGFGGEFFSDNSTFVLGTNHTPCKVVVG